MPELINNTNLFVYERTPDGKILLGLVERGDIPADQNYAKGCRITKLSTGQTFVNVGEDTVKWVDRTMVGLNRGDMLFANGEDLVRLPIGEEGQVLTVVDLSEEGDTEPFLVPQWETLREEEEESNDD